MKESKGIINEISVLAPSPLPPGIPYNRSTAKRKTSMAESGYTSNKSFKKRKPLPFNALRFLANHLKSIKEEGDISS